MWTFYNVWDQVFYLQGHLIWNYSIFAFYCIFMHLWYDNMMLWYTTHIIFYNLCAISIFFIIFVVIISIINNLSIYFCRFTNGYYYLEFHNVEISASNFRDLKIKLILMWHRYLKCEIWENFYHWQYEIFMLWKYLCKWSMQFRNYYF